MIEKRRNKRYPVNIELELSKLFRQDYVEMDVSAPVEVTDISKSGVGFSSTCVLPLDYYFNARLELGDPEKVLYCIVKIIRICADGEMNHYGAEIVGLAPVFDYIFDELENI
ncbi:MAG: PilZ domain-containing protein [Lachnospiraceae bacterium]|jgi:hypothetical protein|nr:PilZ domain-containing protein [Lachnospiraceae bacterium]MBQ5559708.1 PilZ domain-containing protein [Lachnospiraceae bacterium]MCR4802822.1 PilZ domain-containing protein [Lachnospiraceae bacterium]